MDMSRREFLKATAAATTVAVLPTSLVMAQSPAKYRRLNLSDPNAKRDLTSYKKAIRVMLALPPTDPRNWYRNAIVHTLDCPHGNWWFLPWHRAYLGWFEQTCRELSGDPKFAIPYWDWTKDPRVPAAMFDDVLTPTHNLYIPTFNDFKSKFQKAMAVYWKSFSRKQIERHLLRGLRSLDDLWFDVNANPTGKMFFDRTQARGLTAATPNLDPETTKMVSPPWLLDALGARDFTTFASGKSPHHFRVLSFGVLEGFPHNRVHNSVGGMYNDTGGFMRDNLSPVDPIFFAHHANIDRLWDVWERKQKGLIVPDRRPTGYPTLPEGNDWPEWSKEEFLFFYDSKGQPVTKVKAGEYATIGNFAYEYQAGSGEQVVPTKLTVEEDTSKQTQSFKATLTERSLMKTASGSVNIPPVLLAGRTGQDAPTLFAKLSLVLRSKAHSNFKVVINGPDDASSIGPSSPYYAGSPSIFGHHITDEPVTFTVPLSGPLARMRKENLLGEKPTLTIRVVPEMLRHSFEPMAMPSPGMAAEVVALTVEAS